MFISKAEKLAMQKDIANHQDTITGLTIDLYHAKAKIDLFQKSEKQIDELIKICKAMNKRIAKLEGVEMVDKRTLPKSEAMREKHRLAIKKYWAEKKAKEAK